MRNFNLVTSRSLPREYPPAWRAYAHQGVGSNRSGRFDSVGLLKTVPHQCKIATTTRPASKGRIAHFNRVEIAAPDNDRRIGKGGACASCYNRAFKIRSRRGAI